MNTSPTRIYWHRELPPLAAEFVAEDVVEATSDPLPYRVDDRDELWQRCAPSLRAHLEARLEAEITRHGGAYAHVTEEDVTPHVDHVNATYWLIGKAKYGLYRAGTGDQGPGTSSERR